MYGYKNPQTFKSAYEEILASKLGMMFGGCKSAYDRKGEVTNNKTALVESFNENGKLFDFVSANDAEYYNKHLPKVENLEKAGHQNRIPAADDKIGGRKMHESRPHQYTESSKEEAKEAKLASKFRKIEKLPSLEKIKASAKKANGSILPTTKIHEPTRDAALNVGGQQTMMPGYKKNQSSQGNAAAPQQSDQSDLTHSKAKSPSSSHKG